MRNWYAEYALIILFNYDEAEFERLGIMADEGMGQMPTYNCDCDDCRSQD